MAQPQRRRKHVFVVDPDLRDDRTGEDWCLCGLPASNELHDLPKRRDDEVAVENRKTGDR